MILDLKFIFLRKSIHELDYSAVRSFPGFLPDLRRILALLVALSCLTKVFHIFLSLDLIMIHSGKSDSWSALMLMALNVEIL